MKIYNRKNFFIIIMCIVFLVIIDQVSKYCFFNLQLFNNNYFITRTLNIGISWWISFIKVDILKIIVWSILIFIIYLYYKKLIPTIPFIFILSWWFWNFIDRLIYSWVRDFINLHLFPIFNVADILISIWFWLILYYLMSNKLDLNK